MTTVADMVAALDRVAPFDKAAGWDPLGLQIGDPAAAVSLAAVCHDATTTVVERCIADGVDLLVAYHPLLFRPTRRFVSGPDAGGRAWALAHSGIAVAVAHTAFDVAPGGAADSLASAVGISDPVGFGPMWGSDSSKVVTFVPAAAADGVAAAMAAAGAGTIGNYTACSFRAAGVGSFTAGPEAEPTVGDRGPNTASEVRLEMNAAVGSVDAVVAALVAAHPYEEPAYDVYERRGDAAMLGRQGPIAPTALGELAAAVAETLACRPRVAGDSERQVASAAVLPGAGGDFLATADADVVITGDVRHHEARQAQERGIAVIDAGHAATERPGVAKLYAAVAAVVPTVDLTALDADPWGP